MQWSFQTRKDFVVTFETVCMLIDGVLLVASAPVLVVLNDYLNEEEESEEE